MASSHTYFEDSESETSVEDNVDDTADGLCDNAEVDQWIGRGETILEDPSCRDADVIGFLQWLADSPELLVLICCLKKGNRVLLKLQLRCTRSTDNTISRKYEAPIKQVLRVAGGYPTVLEQHLWSALSQVDWKSSCFP